MIDIRIQAADFDPGLQLRRLEELGLPAVASFVAVAQASEEVTEIFVEHHPALAKNELGRMAKEAQKRWSLAGLILIHRHGRLALEDRLAFAAVAATDPNDALAACAFLVQGLRVRAPFWRKELRADGEGRWVEP